MIGAKLKKSAASAQYADQPGRWTVFAIWFAISTAIFLLTFNYRYLDDLANAKTGTFAVRFIEQSTGVYSGTLLFFLVAKFVRRFRLIRSNWWRLLPVHLLGIVALSAVHTTFMALSRRSIFFLAGMGDYDYGIMPIRYVMEFANYALWYAVWAVLLYLFDHYRASREQELRTARLAAQLAQAQLQVLQAQIHPHFLFNALNTISTVIYEDIPAADRMIARLSDFLRHALNTSNSQEVTLREELNFLNLYLDIMRPRFEERLNVEFEIESGIEEALTPKLILQPLVENSIKHAVDPDSGSVRIAVRAARENGQLRVEVEDDGPGLVAAVQSATNHGIGLSNTATRLERLYGADQEFAMRNADGGGLLVSIKLPYHLKVTDDK
jgi:two-component system, LytTR family, sensor kinase